MFDIGFSELIIVSVVGLLILGPERLPHAAKTAGLWVRKIRRSINSVQREINAQLDQEELQQKINETNKRIINEEQTLQNTMMPLTESDTQKPMEAAEIVENPEKKEQAAHKDSASTDKTEQNLTP